MGSQPFVEPNCPLQRTRQAKLCVVSSRGPSGDKNSVDTYVRANPNHYSSFFFQSFGALIQHSKAPFQECYTVHSQVIRPSLSRDLWLYRKFCEDFRSSNSYYMSWKPQAERNRCFEPRRWNLYYKTAGNEYGHQPLPNGNEHSFSHLHKCTYVCMYFI